MKTLLKRLLFVILFLLPVLLNAQIPRQPKVTITVVPNHNDWQYNTGEKTIFSVKVMYHDSLLKGSQAYYEIGPERMNPAKKGLFSLTGEEFKLDGGTLTTPGFLRCTVSVEFEGRQYKGIGTAGFEPLAIKPTVKTPTDFIAFWESAKAELSKVPLNTKMILLADRCTENVNVYQVNLQNIGNSKLYGLVAIPKKEGKYPAVLEVPGAGVKPYSPDIKLAERGVITFVIGIHGIPLTMDPGVYSDLSNGALKEYWTINLDNKEHYYYRRVYVGCVRANDFLTSLPQYDGNNLAVTGVSQGGALTIITASLDSRVKFLAAGFPALCDITGYLSERAGGWPHLFDKDNLRYHNYKETLETIPYYDVVNFAREVKIPGFYTWGFNDEVCPPTSLFSAYNQITAPKTLKLVLFTGHWTTPEQNVELNDWLIEKLSNK
jgi:cephalosporin-C deacetylase-like acetyl esterase